MRASERAGGVRGRDQPRWRAHSRTPTTSQPHTRAPSPSLPRLASRGLCGGPAWPGFLPRGSGPRRPRRWDEHAHAWQRAKRRRGVAPWANDGCAAGCAPLPRAPAFQCGCRRRAGPRQGRCGSPGQAACSASRCLRACEPPSHLWTCVQLHPVAVIGGAVRVRGRPSGPMRLLLSPLAAVAIMGAARPS